MATQRHFIWGLYEALADTNSMSEPEGRQTIKSLLPHLSGIVDFVIDSKGDMKAAEAAETLIRSTAMNDTIRNQFAALKGGDSGGARGVIGSNEDMNANLRAFGNSGKIKVGD